MSIEGGPGTFPTGTDDDRSKPAKVAEQATSAVGDVASTATSSAKDVAGEAATQAKVVAGEAKRQVGNVVDQTRQQLALQADERARQAAGGLRTLSDQVTALSEGRPGDAGPLVGYLGDVQSRVTTLAERLEQAGPQGVLDDSTGFARRRPIVFLAAAAGAGFLVGRLARAGRAVQQDADAAPEPTAAFPSGSSYAPAGELPPPLTTVDGPLVSAVP